MIKIGKKGKKTGIEYVKDRSKPFTVWHDGKIIQFCELLSEAEDVLAEQEPKQAIKAKVYPAL